jgi:hypothetical protein
MKWSALFGLWCMLCWGCRNREKAEGGDVAPFPVVPYLQSQVRHVDTSLYSIVRIRKAQGMADTTYLRREEFRAAATDFLSLPDLASAGKGKYAETKLYDADLKKVVITYMPKPGEAVEGITRQDIIIEPDAGSGDQVQTIYIETLLNSGDSTVQKRLTWNTAGSFQVIKLVNKQNHPETVETTDVRWIGSR